MFKMIRGKKSPKKGSMEKKSRMKSPKKMVTGKKSPKKGSMEKKFPDEVSEKNGPRKNVPR